MDKLGTYDVIVIGAGHAGIEAAHAAARLGARTAVFTLSLDFIGNMPCNPSIGGTAKGHLVREVDALGGLMGLAADATYLQSRMLNRGKGPAVHSLRVQTDRKRYHIWMKHALEQTANLDIHQGEIVGVDVQDGKVCGVFTNLHGYYACKAVVIATGTNLGGRIFVGDAHYDSGPDGTHAATALTLWTAGAFALLRVERRTERKNDNYWRRQDQRLRERAAGYGVAWSSRETLTVWLGSLTVAFGLYRLTGNLLLFAAGWLLGVFLPSLLLKRRGERKRLEDLEIDSYISYTPNWDRHAQYQALYERFVSLRGSIETQWK